MFLDCKISIIGAIISCGFGQNISCDEAKDLYENGNIRQCELLQNFRLGGNLF